jgi:protoporphyrinogen IX oxidase
MNFLLLKAFHIIFVITWFAGLFYIVRLFIYHIEAQEKEPREREILTNQFLLMERRLWYGITWPSAILAIFFGISMLPNYWPLTNYPWLIAKLSFVFFLFLYHLHCGKILKNLRQKHFTYTSGGLRIYNEVSTFFLFAIVFLAVLKNLIHAGFGFLGLLALSLLLFLGIKIYKKVRIHY